VFCLLFRKTHGLIARSSRIMDPRDSAGIALLDAGGTARVKYQYQYMMLKVLLRMPVSWRMVDPRWLEVIRWNTGKRRLG